MSRLGFMVWDMENDRALSNEEIRKANLYMDCEGRLVRFEPYEYDGDIIAYVREPRDLMILEVKENVGEVG